MAVSVGLGLVGILLVCWGIVRVSRRQVCPWDMDPAGCAGCTEDGRREPCRR